MNSRNILYIFENSYQVCIYFFAIFLIKNYFKNVNFSFERRDLIELKD